MTHLPHPRRLIVSHIAPAVLLAPFWLGQPAAAQTFSSTCPNSPTSSRSGTPLANGPQQSCTELHALRIYNAPPVQAAVKRLEAILRADKRAVSAGQQARAGQDAQEIAFGEVERLISYDSANPFPLWFYRPEHYLGTTLIPGGKYAASNSDTVFRNIPLDPNGSYELTGRFDPRTRPGYFSLHLKTARSDSGKEKNAGSFFDTQVVTDEQGNFTIRLDSDPAPAPNHFTLLPGSTGIIIRDTLQDWATELPTRLTIRRLDKAPPQHKADAALIREAVAKIDLAATTVPAFREDLFFKNPPNVLPPPGEHISGNWARATTGNFALQDGQALVFTLNPAGARYLGVQVADILTGTVEPQRRTSTLNNRQVTANADGTITYVLAPRDPGTGNWLDTGGLAAGLLMIRWQGLPEKAPPGPQRLPWTQVVAIRELPAFLKERGLSLPRTAAVDRYRLYMRRYSGW